MDNMAGTGLSGNMQGGRRWERGSFGGAVRIRHDLTFAPQLQIGNVQARGSYNFATGDWSVAFGLGASFSGPGKLGGKIGGFAGIGFDNKGWFLEATATNQLPMGNSRSTPYDSGVRLGKKLYLEEGRRQVDQSIIAGGEKRIRLLEERLRQARERSAQLDAMPEDQLKGAWGMARVDTRARIAKLQHEIQWLAADMARRHTPQSSEQTPERQQGTSASVPVARVSSSRDVGQSGVIRWGDETNRLDVLSEEAGRLGRPAYGWAEPSKASRAGKGGMPDGFTPPHQLAAPPKLPPGIVAPQPRLRGMPAPELLPAAGLEPGAAMPDATATPVPQRLAGEAGASPDGAAPRHGEAPQGLGPTAGAVAGTGMPQTRPGEANAVAAGSAEDGAEETAPLAVTAVEDDRAEGPSRDALAQQIGALQRQIGGLKAELAGRIRAQRAELAAHLAAQHAALAELIRST